PCWWHPHVICRVRTESGRASAALYAEAVRIDPVRYLESSMSSRFASLGTGHRGEGGRRPGSKAAFRFKLTGVVVILYIGMTYKSKVAAKGGPDYGQDFVYSPHD